MSKKIIFVGPPGVGKTTLRKIFFEYESAEQLREYSLDPTYGAESIVLNLGQKIGVFDLAGQENEKWLSGSESDVFQEATQIIIVVDGTSSFEEIVEFTNKVVNIRNAMCASAMIFLLVNKIDLLPDDQIKVKKQKIYARLSKTRKIKIEFTSIMKTYFLNTLIVFRDIIKATLAEEIPVESIDLTLLKDILLVLNQFKDKNKIDRVKIEQALKLSNSRLTEILEILESKQFIFISRSETGDEEINLAEEIGKKLIRVITTYSKERLGIIQQDFIPKNICPEMAPPFIGFLLADESGRTIIVAEGREDALLGMDNIDLISPFISALASFSKEIGIIDMAEFDLKGQNSSIYVYEYENFLCTLFLNKSTDIEHLKDEIRRFFQSIIDDNHDLFQEVLDTGSVGSLSEIQGRINEWLELLCSTYESKVKNLDLFDIETTKQIYERLDQLSYSLTSVNLIYENDIRTLKSRLVSAVMEKNINEIKEISRLTQNFITKITT
jgi:small GTP-binding protein